MQFCPRCGSRLKVPKRGEPVCTSCGAAGSGSASRVAEPRRLTLADHFPYRTMRPFQKDVLEQVEAGLLSKRFVVLEAPVGFGKSAIAASVCSYLGSAYLLTSTKQLQDQYSHDFRFPVVKGKSNFTCLIPAASGAHLPCSKGRCEVDWTLAECPHYMTFEEFEQHTRTCRNDRCKHLEGHKLCPYYDQKWSAFRAPVTVCNYPFFLSELRYTEDVQHRKLLVCDEAHDLERQVVGFASFSLRRSTLDQYTLRSGKTVIPNKGTDEAAAWLGVLAQVQGTLKEYSSIEPVDDETQDRVASCNSILQSLQGFSKGLEDDPENWLVNSVRVAPDGSVEEVTFQPIGVSKHTSELFGAADSILLMSATIFSQGMLCSALGIPEEEVCFVRVPESSFPVENRPIYVLNTAHLSRASMDASLALIARAVDAILERHPTERGVVHTTSYQQVNYIMEHVSETNRARLVTTQGNFERSVLLQMHGATDASVLISPSLYQGVDLKDDLSRFQVIVKVPYPDLSERRTSVKLQRDRGWYDWQTALRLVQTYGRSVRSDTDHATTYVLDSNFTRFLAEHRDLFPKYFLDALRTAEDLPL